MRRGSLLVLTLACGVAISTLVGCSSIDRDTELENAFEALLRYEILRNGTFERYQPVYLGIEGDDPSAEFLKRFDKSKVKLIKRSEVGVARFHYSIGSHEWKSDKHLEINTSYYCGLKCSGGKRFVLLHQNQRWKVTDVINEWVE